MALLVLLSYVSLIIHICFGTLAIAAGLYYLAELVEEYTVFTKKVISFLIASTSLIYVLFIFFENFTWTLILCGLSAQIFHFAIMKNFPFISFLSVPFCGAVLFLIINHFLAFQFFSNNIYSFSEVLAYFTLCLWLVPFFLFVSLSANDYVLPTVNDHISYNGNPDVVSNYFSKRQKKQGLLTLLSSAKELVMGQGKNK